MIACHNNNVVLSSDVAAILIPSASRPYREATAVVIKHHGSTTMIVCRRPNVEHKTILRWEWFFAPEGGPAWLKRWRARRECVTNTSPGHKGRRCFETVLAGDRTSVRNAFECNQISVAPTAQSSVGGFHFNSLGGSRFGPCESTSANH